MVFMPSSRTVAEDDVFNIQFSVENGVTGFDWLPIAPANKRDSHRFEYLVGRLGLEVQERPWDERLAFRLEGPSAPDLCVRVLKDFYNFRDEDELGNVIEGFEWPPASRQEAHL